MTTFSREAKLVICECGQQNSAGICQHVTLTGPQPITLTAPQAMTLERLKEIKAALAKFTEESRTLAAQSEVIAERILAIRDEMDALMKELRESGS